MNTVVELPDVTIERLGRMCLTQANNHFLFGFVFRIKINIIRSLISKCSKVAELRKNVYSRISYFHKNRNLVKIAE